MSPMGQLGRSTINTTLVFFSRVTVQIATFLLVGNLLGAADFAIFTGACACALLLGTLATFGMSTQLLKSGSRCTPPLSNTILPYALPCVAIAGLTLLIVFLLLFYFAFSNLKTNITSILALGVAEIILAPQIVLIATIQQAQRKVALSQLILAAPLILRLTAAAFIYLNNSSSALEQLFFSSLVINTVILLVIWRVYRNQLPKLSCLRLPRKHEIVAAYPFAIINFTTLSGSELDKTLALKAFSEHQAGVYMAASRLIGMASLPLIALITSAMPRLFDTLETKNKTLIVHIFWISLFYGLLGALCIWNLSHLIEKLLGHNFDDIERIIQWMSLVLIGAPLKLSASNILITLNQTKKRIALDFLATISIFFLFFTPAINIQVENVILGLVCTELMLGAAAWFLVFKSYGTHHFLQ